MTRWCLFAAGLVVVLGLSARADLPVAPPPRPAAPRDAEDPAVVVERIITNSKAVTEKLAKTETGGPTQSTQATILKDIDALIDRQENPPPSGGGGGGEQDDKKDQNQQDQNQQNQGQGSGGMGKSGQQPPGGQGGGQQSRGRRPRGGKGGQPPGGHDMANAGGKNGPQPGGAKAGEAGP
ncbi:MAG: hypothetical protein K2X87_12320, partial [Gemmataceae bacterium]|nr:hypothetical protein [Gemmataceae bacterium]